MHLGPAFPHAELVLSALPFPRSSQAPAYLSQSLTGQMSVHTEPPIWNVQHSGFIFWTALTLRHLGLIPPLPALGFGHASSLDFSYACPCAFFSMAHPSCPRVRTATATFSHPATRHSMPPSLLCFSSPQLTAAQASALALRTSHFHSHSHNTQQPCSSTPHHIRLLSSSHQGKQLGSSHKHSAVLNTPSSSSSDARRGQTGTHVWSLVWFS